MRGMQILAALFFFAGIDHLSPFLSSVWCLWLAVCSEVAERWCPEQQSWSWQALAFWKVRDVSRGVGFGKTKGILSYSGCKQDFTLSAASSVVFLLPAK